MPMSIRTTFRVAILVLLIGLVPGLAWAPLADAHTTERPYLYLDVAPDALSGHVEFAASDLTSVFGDEEPVGDQALRHYLDTNRERFLAYVKDHVRIGPTSGDEPWPLEFGRVTIFRPKPGPLVFAVAEFVVVADDDVPARLSVGFDPFFAEIAGRDGLLLVTGAFENGEYSPDTEIVVTYTIDEPTQVVDLGDQSSWDNFRSSITLGIGHIKTGPDHILFILALVLPSVLWFASGAWHPVDRFGAALWRVLKIATFFTIAHSITFTLAGMGWLPAPPAKLVEATIAASVAAAALHNIWPLFPNREWGLSFVFGLFHGMGFAAVVSDLGVSRSSQLLSLLGRNVGIEIGQVVVICLLFPALYLLRRTPWYRPFLIVSSAVLAILAVMWTVERVAEVGLGTDSLVEWAVTLPTGYYLAGAFTLAAAALHLVSRASDSLLATVSRGGRRSNA